MCEEDGTIAQIGNNLVFASVDTSFQNDVTVPANGFMVTFYYNATEGPTNLPVYEFYSEIADAYCASINLDGIY